VDDAFDLVCRVPGLGAAVARLFAQQVRAALQADQAFTLRYLAKQAADQRESDP